jgi:hypothetical protein
MYGGVTGKAGDRLPMSILPVRGPAGTSASVPNKMAQELALLKQPSPKTSIRDSGSAAPNAVKCKSPEDKYLNFKW